MASQQLAITIVLVLIVFVAVKYSIAAPTTTPPLCEPGILEEMPPHIRKVCFALENSNQLSNALTNYIRNEAAAFVYKPEDLLTSNSEKRTDVDHVFLRFGRRR